jgi:tetratricopeptide (TPR) repeat protein
LFTSSVGRWRNYRRHLRPLLTGLAGLVPSEGDEDWDALASEPATALILAVGHHRAGRLDYADAIYRALLRRNPDDPATLHLLGLLCCHRGEPADAVALISRSLALRPDVAPVLADLARALCATGDAPAAIDAAHRALELEPNSPEALLQLGCGLRLQQDAAGAVEVLRRAIELAPRSLEAWVAFAAASTDRKDHKTAELAWQAALELQPDDPGLLQEHAKSLMELKHFDAALAVFRKVDAAVPGQSAARYGMAGALVGSGQISAAADICRQVLEAVPDAMFWLLLANCEAMLGHFDAAADAYRSALALDPRAAGALHDLAVLSRRQDDDVASQAARIVLADPSRSIRDRVAAGFTLGQVYDRQGAYDAAFEAYADANRLLRNDRISQGFLFDRNNFSALVDRQIALIGPQTFVATANWGDPSDVPVFVVGMPRSGTSLVEQIAASHKSVFGAGERTELFGILGNLDGDKTECPPEAWERSAARREATAYVQKLRELGGDAARVIDKQPDNILCLGQIAVLFPRARVVVCRRDLRDVGLSCFFQYFRDDPLVWTDDLADCAFRAREIERLMDHWRQVLPISILEIQYETLVGNLEAESRRLIDFLGLAWDPACLSFHETERAVATASHWQVRQPLYASSAGRWRHYRRHLGPLLRELEGLVPADDGDP